MDDARKILLWFSWYASTRTRASDRGLQNGLPTKGEQMKIQISNTEFVFERISEAICFNSDGDETVHRYTNNGTAIQLSSLLYWDDENEDVLMDPSIKHEFEVQETQIFDGVMYYKFTVNQNAYWFSKGKR